MQLTAEQKAIGAQNFQDVVDQAGVTRRRFLQAAAVAPALGAFYFGYEKLHGSPLKVGFIGTGDEGSVLLTQHPPEYFDIVAIADLRPSNQKRAFTGDGNEHRVGLNKKLGQASASKIKVYGSHKELLEKHPEIEAVVIATPLNTHSMIAIDAMKAGKHVLCEKLMAHSIEQCKQMIRVSRETGKMLAVGHQRHYSVLYANANDLVSQGLLGDIKFIRASWHRNNSFPGSDSWVKKIPAEDSAQLKDLDQQWGFDSLDQLINWRLFRKTGGGLMAELGSHQLDACSIFLSQGRSEVHPLAVQGYGGKNFYGVKGVGSEDKQKDPREIDDHVYVTLEFPGRYHEQDPNDVAIVTYSSINTNRLEPYGETIYGSRGTMVTELEQKVMLFKEEGGDTGGGGPGQRLRVVQREAGSGPVASTSPSLAPAAAAAGSVGGASEEKVSRGYTEEMEHFAWCIRNQVPLGTPREQGGLRCPGERAMADAIMAITSNLAMKHRRRIVFKHEWFDPSSEAVPETDPEVIG